MHHLLFSPEPQNKYPICFLFKSLRKDEIVDAYITPFGLNPKEVLALDLHYNITKKKTSTAEMREYISSELVPVFEDCKVEYIVVTDADYFKALTKAGKVDANLGYIMDCFCGPQKVVYVPNFSAIFYDPPKVRAKIAQGMNALNAHRLGLYTDPGTNIIAFEEYPTTPFAIQKWLDKLLEMNVPLTIDIEAFDLKHHKAGIGTITFCWSKTEGIAFPVDYKPIMGATEAPYGENVRNEPVRKMLREFFVKYRQKAIYHHIAFDVYVLIYQLFMKHILDTEGLLEGMEILLRDWDDTKQISYLATNSCAGNKLGLKDQAQEYAGNYAVDEIKDITKIPMDRLLRYNLVDGLSTWYVHTKHYPTMVADQQEDIYKNLFQPATADIIQMQLTGLPLNIDRVFKIEKVLAAAEAAAVKIMEASPAVTELVNSLNEKWVAKRNSELKTKVVTLADANNEFNPNSGPQLQKLLFEIVGLPVIDLTDSKQPSVGGETLVKLKTHTTDPTILEFLDALIAYSSVNKILTSFIPAMKGAAKGPDDWHYLFGNFNLGGTVSGRLSSSDPNLQNLPANVTMRITQAMLDEFGDFLKQFTSKGQLSLGKLVKWCFMAPPGWVFAGLDFNSLEDRISALTTKDPNKLKVYIDGYDGHSLRAYAYFGDQMPDIVNTVDSINSIQDKHKMLRQLSKAPTFALTYQGTFKTLMNNCGFSIEDAKSIEGRYHELYVVSDQWVADKLTEASKTGYITAAFGLRVRTPLLYQVIRGNSKTPYEAEAEGRTAGNALGQSWCLLNSRASTEFMGGVRKSMYRTDIRPCAHIHDAQYFLIKDDINAIDYTNKYLVKAVEWQEHPDIAHDQVKLGGKLSIFYPDWNGDIEIPNGIFGDQILETITNTLDERDKKSSK